MNYECQSVNMEMSSDGINGDCYMLISNVFPEPSTGKQYITKLPRTCSRYCNKFGDNSLCGNCKCIEKCDSKVPYICDCREVQTTTSSCESAVSSQDVSGIYTITTTQTSFDVLCEKIEGTIWTTYMNLFQPVSSFSSSLETYTNFYGGFTDNFWIGLKIFYHLTQSEDTMVRLEFITESFKTVILEYTGFKILDDTQYRVFYKQYRVIQSESNVEDHMKCRINQPFSICDSQESAWWGVCEDNSPINKDNIRWNLNEKIIRMKMLLKKTALCDNLGGEYVVASSGMTISVTRNQVSGKFNNGRPPFNGKITKNNERECMGEVTFPDADIIVNFEFEENECKIIWSNGGKWTKPLCKINMNSIANCHTMLYHYECPQEKDYYVDPDGGGSAFKVHCTGGGGHEVRTYFFFRRNSEGSSANADITQTQMYDGLYLGNYKYFWIGYRNLYRLTQSINPPHMIMDDPNGYDIFHNFIIKNDANFAMTYSGHGRHWWIGDGSYDDPISNVKDRGLESCNTYLIWWRCNRQNSLPFRKSEIKWANRVVDHLKAHLMQPQ